MFRRKYKVVSSAWGAPRNFWTMRGAHGFVRRTPGARIYVLTCMGWHELKLR